MLFDEFARALLIVNDARTDTQYTVQSIMEDGIDLPRAIGPNRNGFALEFRLRTTREKAVGSRDLRRNVFDSGKLVQDSNIGLVFCPRLVETFVRDRRSMEWAFHRDVVPVIGEKDIERKRG